MKPDRLETKLESLRLKTDMKTKALAAVCRICPFCIAARKWPESAYAKKLKKIEKNCCFCRAYHKQNSHKEDSQ